MKLKNLKPLLLVLITVLLFSCSNDNPTFYDVVAGGSDDSSEDEGGSTNYGVVAQTILENLIIEGGLISKDDEVTTKLPKISNTFDFIVPKYGFLKNGFPIKFNEGSDIPLGVYIQIKTTEGKLSKGHTAFVNDSNIEAYNYVHFSDEIEAGDFCVELYFLTSEGLTDPIEFCIEVPEWGGDNKVTGDWEIYYEYEFYDAKKNIIYKDEYTSFLEEEKKYECASGGSITTFLYRDIISDSQFVLNENGSFHYLNEVSSESLNMEETQNSCAVVWEVVADDEDFEEENGKWFYDEKKAVLYMVSFEGREDRDDDFETYEYGELYDYKVFTEIKGLKLVEIEDEENENYEYAYGIRSH